jgi:hypothetical protein
LVRADIKNFYPSIYTHSIAWALHGKSVIRTGANRNDCKAFLGNRLDRLFQSANDSCTNGLPIGPVVSDIIAEIITSAVDRLFTEGVRAAKIPCEAVRFKDDYRILTNNADDAKKVIKILQAALKEYNLELNDEKTAASALPDGLFRPWVSRYHAAHPSRYSRFRWKQFRELYLAVLEIDHSFPNTGVIDRFLADITTRKGKLKVPIYSGNLEKVISMLLMLAPRRIKAFPKIMAILEQVLHSPEGESLKEPLISYLGAYLDKLSEDEARNKYLIAWLSYFLASNDLPLKPKTTFKDPVTGSILANRSQIFTGAKDFKLFEGVKASGRRVSMFEHLAVFDPPKI